MHILPSFGIFSASKYLLVIVFIRSSLMKDKCRLGLFQIVGIAIRHFKGTLNLHVGSQSHDIIVWWQFFAFHGFIIWSFVE